MMTELLNTLRVAKLLSESDKSTATLCHLLDVSTPTLKRYIDEMRTMGADIESYRGPEEWRYRLKNWDQIAARTLRWIDLEERRDVRASNDE